MCSQCIASGVRFVAFAISGGAFTVCTSKSLRFRKGSQKWALRDATLIIALLVTAPFGKAASLRSETESIWAQYIRRVADAMKKRENLTNSFLRVDTLPTTAANVRRGSIVVVPAASRIPRRVPGGLIHDWIGTMFLADTTLTDILAIVRDYPRYAEVYAPHVLQSKLIATDESADTFSVVFINRSLLSTTAFDCEYETSFVRIDDRRLYTRRLPTTIRPGSMSCQKTRALDLFGISTVRTDSRNGTVGSTSKQRSWRSAATYQVRYVRSSSRLFAGYRTNRLKSLFARQPLPSVRGFPRVRRVKSCGRLDFKAAYTRLHAARGKIDRAV